MIANDANDRRRQRELGGRWQAEPEPESGDQVMRSWLVPGFRDDVASLSPSLACVARSLPQKPAPRARLTCVQQQCSPSICAAAARRVCAAEETSEFKDSGGVKFACAIFRSTDVYLPLRGLKCDWNFINYEN